LAWPLTISETAIPKIRKVRWNAKHPKLRSLEQFLSDATSSYPNLIKVTVAFLGGALVGRILEWGLGFFESV
jgi:hypothetical protein